MSNIDFEDYSNIEKKELDFTPALQFYRSEFTVSKDKVPYFFIEAPAKSLKKNFILFEKIPGVEDFPISTLIQRELDENRARKMYKNYLKSEGAKFYAPLLVVLLPYYGRKLLPGFHESKINTEDILSSQNYDINKFKVEEKYGIAEIYFSESTNKKIGLLTWSKEHIHAVVIDGQHRFKSLEYYCDANHEGAENIKVPMIVLDLRESILANNIPELVRKIFVDINQKVERIDRGRLILLDDLSVPALCVQELLEERDGETQLPLENVDIRCDSGKHLPYYLTGVTTLYYIINDVFLKNRNIEFKDLKQASTKLNEWLTYVEEFLHIDDAIKNQNISSNESNDDSVLRFDTLEKRVDEYLKNNNNQNDLISNGDQDEDHSKDEIENLFELDRAHFELIRKQFNKLWKSCFYKIYRNLLVYSDYWKLLNEYGGTKKNTDLHRYLRSSKNEQSQFLKNSVVSEAKDKLSRLYDSNIFFTVVGQKSIFLLLYKIYISNQEPQIDLFIDDFNSLIQKLNEKNLSGFWNKDFKTPKGLWIWEKFALNASKQVDNTFDAAIRIYSLVSFLLFANKHGEDFTGIFNNIEDLSLSSITNYMSIQGYVFDDEKVAAAFAKPYKLVDQSVDLRSKKKEVKNKDIPQFLNQLYKEVFL